MKTEFFYKCSFNGHEVPGINQLDTDQIDSNHGILRNYWEVLTASTAARYRRMAALAVLAFWSREGWEFWLVEKG